MLPRATAKLVKQPIKIADAKLFMCLTTFAFNHIYLRVVALSFFPYAPVRVVRAPTSYRAKYFTLQQRHFLVAAEISIQFISPSAHQR